jgi:hypothetical protein
MKYTETTESYNERRYGKPWMATTSNDSLTKGFTFLDWDGRPGRAGEFNFDVPSGTILAYGQKDLRKGHGGIDGYQLAMPDGTLPIITDTKAQRLRKLPLHERAAEYARLKIAEAEAEIVRLEAQIEKGIAVEYNRTVDIPKQRAKLDSFRKFLPVAAPAIEYDCAGCEVVPNA